MWVEFDNLQTCVLHVSWDRISEISISNIAATPLHKVYMEICATKFMYQMGSNCVSERNAEVNNVGFGDTSV